MKDYALKSVKSNYYDKRVVYSLLNYPITNFLMLFKEDRIEIPEYQRDLVWDEEQNDLLIESIMMNLPIGNIFLNDKGYGRYELVDGQQRLNAIWTFYSNKYAWHGLYFKDLTRDMQFRFEMFSLATYITKYKERSQVIELYYRINWGGINHSLEELEELDKGIDWDSIKAKAGDHCLHEEDKGNKRICKHDGKKCTLDRMVTCPEFQYSWGRTGFVRPKGDINGL